MNSPWRGLVTPTGMTQGQDSRDRSDSHQTSGMAGPDRLGHQAIIYEQCYPGLGETATQDPRETAAQDLDETAAKGRDLDDPLLVPGDIHKTDLSPNNDSPGSASVQDSRHRITMTCPCR